MAPATTSRKAVSVFALVFGALLLPITADAHPHESLVIKINPENRSQLLELDVQSGRVTVFYQAAAGRISEASVSPNYSRVALLLTSGKVNRLVIVDRSTRVLREIDDDVRVFKFSPDGRKIAYISGAHYGGGVGFEPDGAFVAALDSATPVREIEGLRRPYDLHWLQTSKEDAIYFKVLREGADNVMRFDMKSGRVGPTSLKGIRFSPDGEYVLVFPYETAESGDCRPGASNDSCLRVIETASGEPLMELAGVPGQPRGWLYTTGHNLLFSQPQYTTETVIDDSRGRDLTGSLITGYQGVENLVFEVGSGKPPLKFSGVVPGDASAGGWVTGARGLVLKVEGDSRVCERLPCPEVAPTSEAPQERPQPSLAAPSSDGLTPGPGIEFRYANPRFRWATLAGAAAYRLDVCRDPKCGTIVTSASDLPDPEWRSTPLPIGELFWRVAGIDDSKRLGEFSTATQFFVRSGRIDDQAPSASTTVVASPGEQLSRRNRVLNAPGVQVTLEVEDALSGVEGWRAEVDGGAAVEEVGTSLTLDGPWSDGEHRVDLVTWDMAGNRSESQSSTFIVDAAPPELLFQSIGAEQVASGRQWRRSAFDNSFRWIESESSTRLGIAAAFQDRRGRWLLSRPEAALSKFGSGVRVRSAAPQLFLYVPGAWPFDDLAAASGEGERLLWVTAVDNDSGVAWVELRDNGAAGLEITAADLLGNEVPPVQLGLGPQ